MHIHLIQKAADKIGVHLHFALRFIVVVFPVIIKALLGKGDFELILLVLRLD